MPALVAALFCLNMVFWLVWPASLVAAAGAGWSDSLVGAFGAMAWVGNVAGLAIAPRVARRLGGRGGLWLSALVVGVGALGAFVLSLPGVAFAGALLVGAGAGLRWGVGDAWLANLANEHNRGRWLAFGETTAGLNMLLGPALAALPALSDPRAVVGLAIACVLAGSALAAICPAVVVPAGVRRAAPLGGYTLVAAFGGLFESGFLGAVSVVALAQGATDPAALRVSAAAGFGSFLFQFGLGVLADRLGVRRVLLGCAGGVAALCALWLAAPGAIVAVALLLGGLGGGLYTLSVVWGMALAAPEARTGVIRAAGITYTLGGLAAPLFTGVLLERGGPTLTIAAYAVAGVAVLGVVVADGRSGLTPRPGSTGTPSSARTAPGDSPGTAPGDHPP